MNEKPSLRGFHEKRSNEEFQKPGTTLRQRADLDYEIRRLTKVCAACRGTYDVESRKQAVEAEHQLRELQAVRDSGSYPTSLEWKQTIARLKVGIDRAKSHQEAMKYAEKLELTRPKLERELEAEQRIRYRMRHEHAVDGGCTVL
jgi:hypothetical protein